MIETPTKTSGSSSFQNLTPVRPFSTPKLQSPSTDSNYIAVKGKLDTIIKTLQENYSKWQLAQKRGTSLCSAIEAVKTRSIEPKRKVAEEIDVGDSSLYPHELKAYCDKLAIITSICKDITTNAQESLRQLLTLHKLPGIHDEIFYRSWRMQDFIVFVKELVKNYEKELMVKQCVMEHMAHGTVRDELIRHASAWEYPQYVDESIALLFVFLTEELKIS